MLVAELEVRHTRPIAPTRRVALGALWLPTDPPPGPGGLLLAGVVAAHLPFVDDEMRDGLDVLIDDLDRGRRVVQPRMRHRFQSDTHGLDRSRHRLLRTDGGEYELDLADPRAPLQQILGATYAAGKLSRSVRHDVLRLLRRATRWEGDPDEHLIAFLTGEPRAAIRESGRTESWALTVLGFPPGSEPARSDVQRRFRRLVRQAHPDAGALASGAGERIEELTEAKRILLAAS